ncbi:hypothetical protein KI387_040646, partial [Taxus chinensis]
MDLQLLRTIERKRKRAKMPKVTSRLVIDPSGKKFAEIATPPAGKKKGELTKEDLTITKVPLGEVTTE